jgi:predicted negative regulator of RcsB-dependent stress response
LDDYLSEKEQWENVLRWLRENGAWIFAGVVVGAIAIFGWQWWNAHIDKVNGEASTKYAQLQLDLGKGDRTGALLLVSELQRDYASTPYVDQAHLAMARIYVDEKALDKAAAELQAVIQGSKDKQLALVARVRLARVQIAQQKPDDALATLDGSDPGAFASLFHEVRGDAQFAKGNKAAALTEYRLARTSDATGGGAGGGGDTSLLDLKISDIVAAVPKTASGVTEAAAALAPTSGTTSSSPAAAPAPQNQPK